jgi:hypothetical protein
MKRASLLLFLGAALLFGCRKDPDWPPTGTIELIVKPTWNGTPFDKTQVRISAADERVLIQQVKFFLSGITLKGEGSDVTLSEAELFDLTNGEQRRQYQVTEGNFDSLRFGLGLPVELNHADITQVVPPSPLDFSQGMYWGWATMYRFLLFDGRFDTQSAGQGTPPFQFSIHTGRDTCYRSRAVPLPVQVRQQRTTTVTLNVDIARFFTDGDSLLVLGNGSQSHGDVPSLPIAERLSDFAVKAINP